MTEQPQLDWHDWHGAYDDPDSPLSRRLRVVQHHLARAIDERAGPVRITSMCAGQGRDVIGVLAHHPRRDDMTATLIELDDRNAAIAVDAARDAGLADVRILQADAALTDTYADLAPADILLACGIFGNITDDDIRRTVATLPAFCASGATVIWTRGRFKDGPDTAQEIRRWFVDAGFEEVAFEAPDDVHYRVGVGRLAVPPPPIPRGERMFTFFR